MTEEERDLIKQEIIEQIRFDSALIEELTPAKTLKDSDLFEIDGGRCIPWSRLCSEFRVQTTLDKYRHVDRGQWKEGEMYCAGDTNPYTGLIEVSHVWYFGCKFRCLVTGTAEPPLWSSSDWEFEEGDPSFSLKILGNHPINPAKFTMTVRLQGCKYNQDVTDFILDADVTWRRYTEDNGGNERTDSDSIWGLRRGASGKSITLTEADLDIDIGGIPKVCVFLATAILRDGEEPLAQTASIGYDNR